MRYSEYDTQSPFNLVLRCSGTVWPMVLPYCILNVGIYLLIDYLNEKEHIHIDISSQGHSLMSLIIAFLGVSKVNIALTRYMDSKQAIENAVLSLREISQLAIAITERDSSSQAQLWREEVKVRIITLVEMTVKVIQDKDHAKYLAMARVPPSGITSEIVVDPMTLLYKLRSVLYSASPKRLKMELQLLERVKMIDFSLQYSVAYGELLKIVSTPFPLVLTQLARTIIFVWTLTIPFVLSGGRVGKWSAVAFVIILTYGFMGLEFVAMKMSNPFGSDWRNDLRVHNIAKAAIIGIENDLNSTKRHRNREVVDGMNDQLHDQNVALSDDMKQQALSVYEHNSLRISKSLNSESSEPTTCYAAYPICFCGDDEFT